MKYPDVSIWLLLNLLINDLYLSMSSIKIQIKNFKDLMLNRSFLSQAFPQKHFHIWNGEHCAYSLMIKKDTLAIVKRNTQVSIRKQILKP
jgi:hypothetical protein